MLLFRGKIKACFYKFVIVLTVPKIMTIGCEIGIVEHTDQSSHRYFYERREMNI